MLRKIITLLFIVTSICAWTQDVTYENLAYQFSNRDISGTARIQALGGTNVSIGGNPGSVIQNPAGLGLYKTNDVSMSFGIQTGTAESNYSVYDNSLGINVEESYVRFNVPNLSMIIKIPEDKVKLSNWSKGTIGIGLNRIAHFNSEIRFAGENATNNKRDYYVDQANYYQSTFNNNDEFEIALPAYEFTDNAGNTYVGDELDLSYFTYLINPIFDDERNSRGEYYYSVDTYTSTYQESIIKQRGGIDQLDFSYGTSYDDRFFLGASIGIPFLKQNIQTTYREIVEGDNLVSYTYNQNLETKGTGINLKLGMIWHPASFFRVGLSYESPTWIWLKETINGDMSSYYYNNSTIPIGDSTHIFDGDVYYGESRFRKLNYMLKTPQRIKLGGTFFFGKKAFISADAQAVFYNQMKMSPRNGELDNNFDLENNVIENIYQTAYNFNIGGEMRFNHTYLRAGGAYYTDPLKDTERLIDRSRKNYTGGIGYRDPDWYIDFAVVHTRYNSAFKPYELYDGSGPLVVSTQQDWRFVISTGWTFD